jgi:predicted nucleic acid-binding protein
MWIAAAALVNDQTLATRNIDAFQRVAGLEV